MPQLLLHKMWNTGWNILQSYLINYLSIKFYYINYSTEVGHHRFLMIDDITVETGCWAQTVQCLCYIKGEVETRCPLSRFSRIM